MKDPKIELGFSKLSRALISLEDIVFKPMLEDRSNIDATIQRFEFTIELFWKLLRVILESKGVAVQYPKDVLREAFKGHLIDHEQEWLKMLLDRNITSHTYDEQLADKIYNNIKSYIPTLRSTFDKLNFLNQQL
ncbi:HI0074 family nucleotidyltransferase substrate-binding subunit [Candidatus Tisiphia endosymbiont of Nedyus quadrimaculatus]|uniref:HI0074 family nucleotidyltransferase substrate-binding subunit n=1 Tax=Candidatus Tisiphia endosymbiont of Nedyus quadrimaculatus TaxID=3139332 RepID=UPI00345EF09F